MRKMVELFFIPNSVEISNHNSKKLTLLLLIKQMNNQILIKEDELNIYLWIEYNQKL